MLNPTNVEETIKAAKAALPSDLAAHLIGLELKEDDGITAIAVKHDLTDILYNREFMSKLSFDETIFAVGNIALHVKRAKETGAFLPEGVDQHCYNIACDYVHNPVLVDRKVGKAPRFALYDKAYIGMTVEQVYDIVKDSDFVKVVKQPSEVQTSPAIVLDVSFGNHVPDDVFAAIEKITKEGYDDSLTYQLVEYRRLKDNPGDEYFNADAKVVAQWLDTVIDQNVDLNNTTILLYR